MGKNFVDPLLTNVALGYRPLTHVNEILLPTLTVAKMKGVIGVYGADNMRLVATVKSPAGETPVVEQSIAISDAYVLEKHGVKAFAADEDIENQEGPFDEMIDKAELTMDTLSVGREYALASVLSDRSKFGTNTVRLSGTGQWGSTADDPIGNLAVAIRTTAEGAHVGAEQLTVMFSSYVWNRFRFLPETIEFFKYTTPNAITTQMVAAMLGVKQVIVANGVYNTAVKGQTATFANIWGKHVWVAYVPASPKKKEYCLGYTPRMKAGVITTRWYDQDREGWWIKSTDQYDQYLISVDKCAYLIEDACA